MENKSISGQRGICAWMAYLVMRNESSKAGRKRGRWREKASVRGKGDREDE